MIVPLHPKAQLALAHDVLAVAGAWIAAYWLRFNLDIPITFYRAALGAIPGLVAVYATVFLLARLYRGIWRYASLDDLKRIMLAVTVSGLIVSAGVSIINLGGIPRSVLILHPLLLAGIMGSSRLLYRAWKEHRLYGAIQLTGKSVLVLGAGDAAADLLRELARSAQWRVVGLLDDDAGKQGRQINGVRVLGTITDVERIASGLEVSHVIVAMPGGSAARRRRAAEHASRAGLQVLTVPAFEDLLSGRVAISQVRKVELEDLLGRDQVQLDDAGLQGLLTGKVALITGAGGSIGSELCRQIVRFKPKLLVFYELSELALYAIEQEFSGRADSCAFACVVGDVKDKARLQTMFSTYRPNVVFHAAAYKHVPMMENENAWEAVRNNVCGTLAVVRASVEHQVGEFVLISTDKAVNPTNVMGASKRLAELACQALQQQHRATRLVMVRFGNVLGSSGSVIPRFRQQIAAGGPVTVTHPDIIRYFMLIPEAAQLVLQAGLVASRQPDGGQIFVLDMGEPVKIVDLARDLIRLSGFTEDEIKIEFTGLRPGEKLYEELLADSEATLPTPHPKLRIAEASAAPAAEWLADLELWLSASSLTEAEVKLGLKLRVPEYQPAVH
jgi:FlaA1/EpsC-like NDP-sugar epimerase